jgi:hypothetical protein
MITKEQEMVEAQQSWKKFVTKVQYLVFNLLLGVVFSCILYQVY